ncbi:MAG: LysR family transcriptional regulator [Lachnospira eligens]
MITEKDMQYVLTIANYGNLTKAANALFLSQPALSIHLKQLENFTRSYSFLKVRGRQMILTYAGEEFVKSARDITMKCFELEDRMIDIGKNVAVKLRIGYMVRQVESLFPSVMTAFNRLYPQSVVYAIDGHLSDHEEQLLAGDLDMFFGYNSVSNTRLSYETIYERLSCCHSSQKPSCCIFRSV